MKTISVNKYLHGGLSLRSYAKDIMNDVLKHQDCEISLDFNDVEYISRSFAHELIMDKRNTKKTVTFINKNPNVDAMFCVVESSINQTNTRKINIKLGSPISI